MSRPIRSRRDPRTGRGAWRNLQLRLTRGGWPARWALRLGDQQDLKIRRDQIQLATAEAFPPLRVAFATDFHAGPSTHPELLDRVVAELRRLEPELVLLGGDFVCLHASDIRRLARSLSSLAPPLGVFAVLGNHDYWTDAEYVARALTRAGVTVLVNRSCRLPAPWQNVWVCGMDDAAAGNPDPAATFAGADGVRLLLTHAPGGLGVLGSERFDLALCGHTHGGQLALPGGIPLYLPAGHWSRRYAAGRFDLPGRRSLVVSRGVGYSTVPFRAFCDPELHLLDVVSAVGPAGRPGRTTAARARISHSRIP